MVFRLSFGGSGVQARAVMDGLPADIVALALPLDIDKIAERGLLDSNWRSRFPNNSNVSQSTIALVLREGNPKGVRGWEDLTRGDLEVICSNPKTAGVARWNFLALWGHKMARGDREAVDYLRRVFERVPVQPRDAREASDVFYNQRKGDVLITYENEVRLTNWACGRSHRGPGPLPYLVPDNNIRVEMPIALVDRNLERREPEAREAAKAFVEFLYGEEAQREMMQWGFRPIDRSLEREAERAHGFPSVRGLWRVDDKLGGWTATQRRFFDTGKVCDSILSAVAKKQLQERLAARR